MEIYIFGDKEEKKINKIYVINEHHLNKYQQQWMHAVWIEEMCNNEWKHDVWMATNSIVKRKRPPVEVDKVSLFFHRTLEQY